MKLITKALHDKLRANSIRQTEDENFDPKPVVKLFHPMSAATWLLTEIDEDDGDRAFGLCDLGLGYPELGYVSLTELETVKVFGLGVERDLHWTATKTISEYATAASDAQRIVA